MSDSPLSCDLPETDIEQQLEKRLYRTYGERLASRNEGGRSQAISPHQMHWGLTPCIPDQTGRPGLRH